MPSWRGWVLGLPLLLYAGSGGPPAAGESARRAATVMYEAFLREDYEVFAQYTHPRAVELNGGKAATIALVKTGMAEMRQRGFTLKSAAVALPLQMVSAGRELHAVLPITIVMSAPGGELRAPSHLLGVSADQGRSWTFMDTGKLTAENVKLALPGYNPALKLPAKVEPTFVPAATPAPPR
jgi:hypothetical protein